MGRGWARRARGPGGLGREGYQNYGGRAGLGQEGYQHEGGYQKCLPKLRKGLPERSRKAATFETALGGHGGWGGRQPFVERATNRKKTINSLGFFDFFYDLFTILVGPTTRLPNRKKIINSRGIYDFFMILSVPAIYD